MNHLLHTPPRTSWSDRRSKTWGTVLVAGQFGVLLALALTVQVPWGQGGVWLVGLAGLAVSGGLGFWTLTHNRLGNFNIRPAPKEAGSLVTSGPYRWIRHPMYTAVLVLALVLAIWATQWAFGLTLWLVLVGILWTKAALEERWMGEHHPAYVAYMGQSKRFLPWLV